MAAILPRTLQPPPDLPNLGKDLDTLSQYLRTFSLWCRHGFADKLSISTATPQITYQTEGVPPEVWQMKVTDTPSITLTPIAFGSGKPGTPVEIAPAPPDSEGFLPLEGGTLTGDLAGTNASFSGDVSSVTAHFTGVLTVGPSYFDANGNFGLGTIPPAGQSIPGGGPPSITGLPGAGGAWMFGWGVTLQNITNNLYFDGTEWRYWQDGAGSLYQPVAGSHSFSVAPVGSAGDVATTTPTATISGDGNVIAENALIAKGSVVYSDTVSGNGHFAIRDAAAGEAWKSYWYWDRANNQTTVVDAASGVNMTFNSGGAAFNTTVSTFYGIRFGNVTGLGNHRMQFDWNAGNWGCALVVDGGYPIGNWCNLISSHNDATFTSVRNMSLYGAAGVVYAWYSPSAVWQWPNTSDIRTKSNIKPAEKDALAALNSLKVVECDVLLTNPGAVKQHWNWAVIADDKLGEAVPTSYLPADDVAYASIRELPLVAALVKAVQQLTKRVEELEGRK